jgi:hypothetical protein
MTHPIDYGRPARPKPSIVISSLLLIAGVVPLALGSILAYFAWSLLGKSGNAGFSWGPGFYVYNMLQSFVYFALVAVPLGAAMVLAGLRRLGSLRSGST